MRTRAIPRPSPRSSSAPIACDGRWTWRAPVLRQGGLTRGEGEVLVALAREQALQLFPGKSDVFDLVLAPRFRRVLDEFCKPPPTASCRFGGRSHRLTQVKSRITPAASKKTKYSMSPAW